MTTHRADVSVVFGVPAGSVDGLGNVPPHDVDDLAEHARLGETRDRTPCHAPDLVGLSAMEAHAEARSTGVRLSVSVWETTVGPWGMVIDQRPSPGTRVRRGGRLHVIVSGRPHAPLPEVCGLPLEAAIERLCWLGFVPLVKARRSSSSVPAGHVLATYPPAGTLLTDGSVVALTLARRHEMRRPSVGGTDSSGE